MLPEVLKKTLFVDLETVSAEADYKTLDSEWKVLWQKQAKQSYMDRFEGAESSVGDDVWANWYAKKAGIHAEFGKIVCLSMGLLMEEADKVVLRVKSLTGDEKTILETFNKVVPKFNQLCAHNGKKFDFPYISRRMHILNLLLPEVLQVAGKKPWEINNVDTMDMWRFGDQVYPSLDLLAKSLGLPLKSGLDGSSVHSAYYVDGDLKKISEYCANDVVLLTNIALKLGYTGVQVDKVVIA